LTPIRGSKMARLVRVPVLPPPVVGTDKHTQTRLPPNPPGDNQLASKGNNPPAIRAGEGRAATTTTAATTTVGIETGVGPATTTEGIETGVGLDT
jgi:hypothetical protein